MKTTLLTAIILLVSQVGFSQTEKLIKGNVSNENFPIQGVEIINQTSKKVVISDKFGNFSIPIKMNDNLVIFLKDYTSQEILIDSNIFSKPDISIELLKKAIQIEEVVVERKDSWSADYMQQIIDKRYTDDGQTALKNNQIYTGSITDGLNLIAVGKAVGKLFKNKNKPKQNAPQLEFKDYITTNFNQSFFSETLKIKPEDVLLFLEFCEADPKSKNISKQNNELAAMDFLVAKNYEFKKTNRILNNSKP